MNTAFSFFNPTALAILLLAFWFMVACHRTPENVVPKQVIQLSAVTTVSELLAKATDASVAGNESCTFQAQSGNLMRIEFPLLDGNKKHWQFKALQEIGRQHGELEEVTTSEATVLFISRSDAAWSIGKKAYSDIEIESRIKALASNHKKSVLVIRARGSLPVTTIERIWVLAHAVGTRLVLFDSIIESEDTK